MRANMVLRPPTDPAQFLAGVLHGAPEKAAYSLAMQDAPGVDALLGGLAEYFTDAVIFGPRPLLHSLIAGSLRRYTEAVRELQDPGVRTYVLLASVRSQLCMLPHYSIRHKGGLWSVGAQCGYSRWYRELNENAKDTLRLAPYETVIHANVAALVLDLVLPETLRISVCASADPEERELLRRSQ